MKTRARLLLRLLPAAVQRRLGCGAVPSIGLGGRLALLVKLTAIVHPLQRDVLANWAISRLLLVGDRLRERAICTH